jgi:hypothetical protein
MQDLPGAVRAAKLAGNLCSRPWRVNFDILQIPFDNECRNRCLSYAGAIHFYHTGYSGR